MLDRLNRHDLSDEERERLRVFLPADPPRGGRWSDHQMVINGIFFRARAGCPWRDLPEGFGNWKTVYNRHRRWSLDGTWEKILDGLAHYAEVAVLSLGMYRRLQVDPRTLDSLTARSVAARVAQTREAVRIYNDLADGTPVAGLFQSMR